MGNRTDSGVSLQASSNRYGTFRGYSYTYDLDGNLTRKWKTGFDQQLTWNALGQLQSVTTNGVTTAYGYSGFGVRVRRTQGSATTRMVYDGDDLLLETDGNGALLREYVYYPGIDQPHSVRVWAGGAGGAIYRYVTERPGHVVALLNASNGIANKYKYSPWGEADSTTQAVVQPLRFMARELDETTGLYYVRNRWYDPVMARFVSEDPIGLAGGINMYAYVGNNPLNARDPLGLKDECELEADLEWTYTTPDEKGMGGGFVFSCVNPPPPLPPAPGANIPHSTPGISVSGGRGGATGSGDPARQPDWSQCGSDALDAGLGVAGDALLVNPAGLVIKGSLAVRAGRAAMAAAHGTGRGAMIRGGRRLVRGGSGMMRLGVHELGYGVAGSHVADGMQNSVWSNSSVDTNWAKFIPFVGTTLSLIDAAKSCGAAVAASL